MADSTNKPADSPHHSFLEATSGRLSILVVGAAAVFLIIMDYSTGIFVTALPLWRFITTVSVVAIGALVYVLLRRRQARIPKVLPHLFMNVMVFYILAYILPIPSPYLIFSIILPLLVYFDFGVKKATITLVVWYAAIAARFAQLGELGTKAYGTFVVYFVIGAIFFYYVLRALKAVDGERQALEVLGEQTEDERGQLLTLVNNLEDAVLACDKDLHVVLSNPRAYKLLGDKSGLSGKSIDQLLDLRDEERRPVSLANLLAAKSNERVSVFSDYRKLYGENDFMNLYIAVSRIASDEHINDGYVVLLRDITKAKSLEDERNEFISVMSHELRTPITVAEGGISLAQSLNHQGNKEKTSEFLDKAHAQILMLAAIVNDLSDLAPLGNGEVSATFTEFDTSLVVDQLKQTYQPQAETKGLQLVINQEANLPVLYSSQQNLTKILGNLLSNGIKYTKQGQVSLEICRSGDSNIAFSVVDSGIGISQSDKTHLFKAFWRSEDFHTRESGGTGLGLYGAKKLAEGIGGRITVDSELGKGSAFTLIIPIRHAVLS